MSAIAVVIDVSLFFLIVGISLYAVRTTLSALRRVDNTALEAKAAALESSPSEKLSQMELLLGTLKDEFLKLEESVGQETTKQWRQVQRYQTMISKNLKDLRDRAELEPDGSTLEESDGPEVGPDGFDPSEAPGAPTMSSPTEQLSERDQRRKAIADRYYAMRRG